MALVARPYIISLGEHMDAVVNVLLVLLVMCGIGVFICQTALLILAF